MAPFKDSWLGQNWWKVLIALLIAVIIYLMLRPVPTPPDYNTKQHSLDSAYEALQTLKKQDADRLRIDSAAAALAKKKQDSIATKLLIQTAENKTAQANSAYWALKYQEAKGQGDKDLQLADCGEIVKQDSILRYGIDIERAMKDSTISYQKIQIQEGNDAYVAQVLLLGKTDSLLTAEHANGQQLTKDILKADKKIKNQSTFLKIAGGVVIAMAAVVYELAHSK
jgi:hypothetical protein